MSKQEETRQSKVVDGIHFLWVPAYKGSRLREHWISLNGKMQVRVYPPIIGGEHPADGWSVSAHAFGQRPGEVGFQRSHGWQNEKEAFKVALNFVNY